MTHLIVNADDFGATSRVNSAILRAHVEGILTSASVMVAESGFAEARLLARETPSLALGLHVVLSDGAPCMEGRAVSSLLGSDGRFVRSPALAGMRVFFSRDTRRVALREIEAQAALFGQAFDSCDHVNGHQHLHMHPVVWDALVSLCPQLGCGAIRVPAEELRPVPGAPTSRILEWAFFRVLARRCRRSAHRAGLLVADRVYGHLASGVFSEQYLAGLLPRLRAGICEVYAHPGREGSDVDAELAALVSLDVKRVVRQCGLRLTTYSQLARHGTAETLS